MSADRAWELANGVVTARSLASVSSSLATLEAMEDLDRRTAILTLREEFNREEARGRRDYMAMALLELSPEPDAEAIAVLLSSEIGNLVERGRDKLKAKPELVGPVVSQLRSEMVLATMHDDGADKVTRILKSLGDLGRDAAPALDGIIKQIERMLGNGFADCEGTALPFAAARAVGEAGAGNPKAAEILLRLLSAPEIKAQASARTIPGHLLGAEIGAISALGKLCHRESEGRMVYWLMDQREHIRNAAALALAEMAPISPRYIRAVRYALNDCHPGVVQSACIALGRTGRAAKAESLIPLLDLVGKTALAILEKRSMELSPCLGQYAALISNLVWSLLQIDPTLADRFPHIAELRLGAPYIHLWEPQGQRAMADYVKATLSGQEEELADVLLGFVQEASS